MDGGPLMEIGQALDHISEIHGHLAKTEVYRGYRSLPVAFSGLLALAAAWVQPRFAWASAGRGLAVYWIAIAAGAGLVCGGGILYNYAVHAGSLDRRRTERVLGQFAPALVAGACVTPAIVLLRQAELLPPLWSVLFALGVFASRPYLPRAAGWVALFYLAAGLLALYAPDAVSPGWSMGLTFGLGQLGGAAVLYWNLEREAANG